jgi:DNA-binding LacI/PurR family transcriptional regulator
VATARGIRVVHRPCEGTHAAAAAAITAILEDRPGTTGLIVPNEAIIAPLLSVLRTAGRAVPEEVSVVAICPAR